VNSPNFNDAEALCRFLSREYASYYVPVASLPEPYFIDTRKVNAIVLGTDPTNPDQKRFQYVFGLGGSDTRYFKSILKNLDTIGLSPDQLYIQNLCRNYFTNVTSENAKWQEIAALWRPLLQKELDGLFGRHTPVFITAWDIYPVLAIRPARVEPSYFYKQASIIDASENHLGRPIIAFFRHPRYDLKNWGRYREVLMSVLK
jgi:hypothetical protein